MSRPNVRVIVFDVVGTLLYPQPSVADAYLAMAVRHGSRLDRGEVQRRFRTAFARHFSPPAAADEPTDELLERARWRDVVTSVFAGDVADDQLPSLFDALWLHFAEPQNWRTFADVHAAWQRLEAAGFRLVLGSNFDERLLPLVHGHEPLCRAARVFPSSQVGYAKPSPRFFLHVAEELDLPPEEILMVGDDQRNDYHAPRAAGWQALLLDRSGDVTGPHVVRDLAEFATAFISSGGTR